MEKLNLKTVICLALVVLYIAGMLLMLFGSVTAGILLWSVSTVGGLFALWYIHSTQRAADDGKSEEAHEDEPQ